MKVIVLCQTSFLSLRCHNGGSHSKYEGEISSAPESVQTSLTTTARAQKEISILMASTPTPPGSRCPYRSGWSITRDCWFAQPIFSSRLSPILPLPYGTSPARSVWDPALPAPRIGQEGGMQVPEEERCPFPAILSDSHPPSSTFCLSLCTVHRSRGSPQRELYTRRAPCSTGSCPPPAPAEPRWSCTPGRRVCRTPSPPAARAPELPGSRL